MTICENFCTYKTKNIEETFYTGVGSPFVYVALLVNVLASDKAE